jgi:3-methyladenine DNA glycosylase Tag
MKMKECLDRLRRNKDDKLKDLIRNKEKLKSMFVNALKSMRLAEQKALSSLKIHKE